MPDLRALAGRWPHPLAAALLGVVHGLLARLAFGFEPLKDALGVMTASFIFLVPLSIGAVSVAFIDRKKYPGWGWWLLFPIVPAWIALFAALLLAWEGIICIVLWLPIYTVMAWLGGIIAGIVVRLVERRRDQQLAIVGLALLPYIMAPAENQLSPPLDLRRVENTIDIAAPPDVIWRNISSVRRFQPSEHHFSWVHAIGFPRPVEATLSHEGVGGVRRATFEGGVVFLETITDWEPQQKLTFSIKANTDAIPARTLDEHVVIGGPYFDVLEGEYELEPLPSGGVRLHLRSRTRLSTAFNAYASLWTDFIMSDVQSYILSILKVRCEREA